MLIIPGGSLVESQSVNTSSYSRNNQRWRSRASLCWVSARVFRCWQKKPTSDAYQQFPITREGLGLLDAEFKPLVCTDRVTATVVDKSFITQEVGKEVSGFHCHTYGKIILHKDARSIIVTHAKRVNYKKDPQDLISGVANKQGNVVGIFIHGLLDQNPTILESITKSLGINAVELEEIRRNKRETFGAN